MEPTDALFPWLAALPFIWITGLIGFGVWRLKNAGQSVLNRRPERADFYESGASGRNLRTWYTRLGGANRCLNVTVVERRLKIDLGFPINVMMPMDLYGLRRDVRLSDIRSIERRSALLSGEEIVIRWSGDEGYALTVKNADQLIAALDPHHRLVRSA